MTEVATTEVKQEIEVKKEIPELSEEQLKEKTKKICVKEGVAATLMTGAGSNYITPYALAIGASSTQIGLLTSIPSLLGNLSQLLTPKFIEKFSRKTIIIVSVFLQALMWIPMILAGYLFFYNGFEKGASANLLILFFTLFTIFGAFLSPAWNSLVKDVVTKNCGDYFGRRHRILGAVSLAVFILSGIFLSYFEGVNLIFVGFFILFDVAFFSRLVSGFYLTKYYEPKLKLEKGYYFTFWQFIKKIPQSNFGKFTVFVSLISLGTSIASPFFSVYMLRDLKFNYSAWMIITVSGSLSTFLFVRLWGKFADRFGNFRVLQFAGMFIPIIPIAWFLSPIIAKISFPVLMIYLFSIEFISGFVWGGFNLSALNFIYDAVTRERLALCIAYYNVLNGVGVFIGATLGGILAATDRLQLFGLSSLLTVFLISGVVRLMVYTMMMPLVKEVRDVEKYQTGEFQNEMKKMLLPIHSKPITNTPQSSAVPTPASGPVSSPESIK